MRDPGSSPIFDEVCKLYPALVWVDYCDTTEVGFMQTRDVIVVESNHRLMTLDEVTA